MLLRWKGCRRDFPECYLDLRFRQRLNRVEHFPFEHWRLRCEFIEVYKAVWGMDKVNTVFFPQE